MIIVNLSDKENVKTETHETSQGLINFNVPFHSQKYLGFVSYSAQAAMTKYHRLGGLHNRHFWSIKVWDQGASPVRFEVLVGVLFLGCRKSFCPHTMERELERASAHALWCLFW